MEAWFDSRSDVCKIPWGAVRQGETIKLRLLLAAEADQVWLHWETDDIDPMVYPMQPGEADQHNHTRFWEISVAPEYCGCYFYSFSYVKQEQRIHVYRDEWNHAVERAGQPWQVTVYDPAFHTPDWVKGGLIYQIFPDRFAASRRPKDHVPDDRYLQTEWNQQPAYLPGESGCVINNDYYGGDLQGITEKLDYLASLGVTCLYLNPIFEAHSNHRYNTANYLAIDPLLGTNEDFSDLCAACHARGIRLILDGVFSHTGADSVYFNQQGRYDSLGACQSPHSAYYEWYTFIHYPTQYKAWWNVPSLPEVREENPSYLEFITGPNGVLRTWLCAGADGWRLDVADELPDVFLDRLRSAVKEENPEALIIGEVWENASNKVSYGHRRRYLQGAQLDSVMNYPFCDAIFAFLRGGSSADLMETIMTILETYPAPAVHALMNHVGTHDTPRLITALVGEPINGRDRAWQASQTLTAQQMDKGLKFVRLAAILQYTLPGVPSLYYGDERGMQGYADPFNRAAMNWDDTNAALTAFYCWLGKIRACPAFMAGDFIPVFAEAGHIVYIRQKENDRILIGVNRWCDPQAVSLPDGWEDAVVIAGNPPQQGQLWIPAEGYVLLADGPWAQEKF